MRSTSFAPAGFLTSRIESGAAVERRSSPRARTPPRRPRGPPRRRPSGDAEREAQRGRRRARCRRCRGRGAAARPRASPRGVRSVNAAPRMPSSSHVARPRPPARAARGRSSGSGSGRGGRGRRPRRRRRAPQRRQCLESDGVLELRQRLRVVLDAEVGDAVALAPEVGDERVVGVQHEAARRRRARPTSSAQRSAMRLELAVAVELVAEQVAEQQRARVELARDRPAARTRRPRTARARRRSPPRARRRAAPRRRRRPCSRPARLCTSRAPVRSRIAAIIAAVVVLPLVAETSDRAAVAGARASSRDRVGLEAHQQPCRAASCRRRGRRGGRARRRARGEPRPSAPSISAAARATAQRAAAATRTVAGSSRDRVAVGVERERPVGARPRTSRAAQDVDARARRRACP